MNLKGVTLTYQQLLNEGFDFNAFEYKANIIVKDKETIAVLNNVLVIQGMAIAINKDKTVTDIFRFSF